MGIKICWHGCASFSLRLYGQEFLFDPFFSPAGEHGPGRTPNDHAPSPAAYLRAHWPDLCLITGGRYDHCDIETVRRLGMIRPQLRFLASDEVVGLLRRSCALADACVWPTEIGDVYHMGTVRIETLAAGSGYGDGGAPGADGAGAGAGADGAGTDGVDGADGAGGADGTGASAAGGKTLAGGPSPAHAVGGEPSGGRQLSFRLTADLDRVYISGDTTLSGVPRVDATIAVLCVGGRGTAGWDGEGAGEPHPPILAETDIAAAVRRLSARVVIPIHWDFGGLATQVDVGGLKRRLAEEMPAVAVVVPPYNEWIEVEA